MRISYRDSSSRRHEDTLLAWLLSELPTAQQLLVASGYFDGSILNWLERPLRDLLDRGGSAHFAVGSNQGTTQREDLERLLGILSPFLNTCASLNVIYIPGATYHPKIYFVRRPGHFAALVGSPNLTAASGLLNVETAVVLESEILEPPLDAIEASVSPAAIASSSNAYPVASPADLGQLAAMRVIDVPRPVAPTNGQSAGSRRRVNQARLTRFPPIQRIAGTPSPTARPSASVRVPAAAAPATAPTPPAAIIVVFVFSGNDLKLTGTREMSVPEAVRAWAGNVLGGPVRPGQGDLMHINLQARLAQAPASVVVSPGTVRLWSAGASGGTHQDVRLVLGNRVRSALEDESVDLYGGGLEGGDIGVLELPGDPGSEPLRLTVYRQADPDYPVLLVMTSRVGRQQKPQVMVQTLPLLPPWPY